MLHEIYSDYRGLDIRQSLSATRFVARPIDHRQAAVEPAIKGCQRAGGGAVGQTKHAERDEGESRLG